MSEEHSKQTSEVLKRQISELEGINDTLSQGLYWFLTFTAYSAVWRGCL